jgi:flagellar motor switch protein FliN/FliY
MAQDGKKLGDADDLGLLLHVPLHLTVELGSCRMPVSEILKLGTGSVVELDRPANAPVELLVNNRPVARGEIVAVDERFGLRITELLTFQRPP